MIRIALHLLSYTLQLQHNSIFYYYTVSEMRIFLSEVDWQVVQQTARYSHVFALTI